MLSVNTGIQREARASSADHVHVRAGPAQPNEIAKQLISNVISSTMRASAQQIVTKREHACAEARIAVAIRQRLKAHQHPLSLAAGLHYLRAMNTTLGGGAKHKAQLQRFRNLKQPTRAGWSRNRPAPGRCTHHKPAPLKQCNHQCFSQH